MHCYLIVKLTVLTLFIDLFFCETTKEPQTEMVLENTSNVPAPKEIASDSKHKKQRRVTQVPFGIPSKDNQPNFQAQRLHQNDRSWRVLGKTPHYVTKLTKPLQYGFDPYFRKGYFEFESRPKPITLVAFRKNGISPRKITKEISTNTDVAILQSPFNLVSNFWADIDDHLPSNDSN